MKIDQNSIRGPYKLRTHAAIMAGQYHSRGFTLIELMIVIVIIGVIAAIALPAYANYVARAQVNRTFIEISAYRTAVEISLANGDSAALGVNAKEEVGFQDSSINSVTFGSFADAANSTIVATRRYRQCKYSWFDGDPQSRFEWQLDLRGRRSRWRMVGQVQAQKLQLRQLRLVPGSFPQPAGALNLFH